ncbi:calcium-binding protein, partial [Pseudomonas syringae]|uniref:calcium-binding protein n=1 Tax=Pseudomonas syringae TaxID=317 RepID=UPI000BD0F9E6
MGVSLGKDGSISIEGAGGINFKIDRHGAASITDKNGNEIGVSSEGVSFNWGAGKTKVSISGDGHVEGTIEITPTSEVSFSGGRSEGGAIGLDKVKIDTPDVGIKVGPFGILELGADAYLEWTPGNGATLGLDEKTKIFGKDIEDIVDGIYDFVKDSFVGEMFSRRGEWIDEFADGRTNLSYFNWLKQHKENGDKAGAWTPAVDPSGIGYDVYSHFKSAQNYVDPLVLDLDGDGIETVSNTAGVVFDFDGDGKKNGTGWVSADDGVVVLDRDGNGSITDGSEMFGVDSVLRSGLKARNGFEALADLDSNEDGIFDIDDEQFESVRVWQDFNQDGISQATELKTLKHLGIVSINAAGVNHGAINNENIISNLGAYTRIDALSGVETSGVVGTIDFAQNTFYREFSDTIELDQVAKYLPNMQGSGAVRDLREASMLSDSLKQALADYTSVGTRQEQLALVGRLLSAWAGTSTMESFDERIEDLSTGYYKVKFSYSWEKPDTSFIASNNGVSSTPGSAKEPTDAQLAQQSALEKIKILEAFTGIQYFNFSAKEEAEGGDKKVIFSASSGNSAGGRRNVVALMTGPIYITEENLSLQGFQIDQVNSAYNALIESVYNGLLLQTRLQDYTSLLKLKWSENGFVTDYSGIINALEVARAIDPVKAIVDGAELAAALQEGAWNNSIAIWLKELDVAQLAQLKSVYGGANAVFLSSGFSINYSGTGSADFLIGAEGGNYLEGYAGNDFIMGDAGDDSLGGGSGSDVLSGGEGNDSIYGGSGNDLLQGDTGSDYLNGGEGSDTYFFQSGWGQDTIVNLDSTSNKQDVIRFSEDISPNDMAVARNGDDLLLIRRESNDRVTVSGYFDRDVTSSYMLELISFSNGIQWSVEDIKAMVIVTTDGNDKVWGYATDDTLNGGSGDDSLYGQAGNDTLQGGAGVDSLSGGAGNDALFGEGGNDYLYGGAGTDQLSGGDGSDYLTGGEGNDTLTG